MSQTEEPPVSTPEPFQPSPADVYTVKAMLGKAFNLPAEIIDAIVEHAEYWPHSTTMVDLSNQLNFHVYGGRLDSENKFVLRTRPLGFIKQTHPSPTEYQSTQVLPIELEKEHPIETYQKWIGSPKPTIQHPARKVVFTISSRDQGWGGDPSDWGTYKGSWTWFDVGLERFDAAGTCQEDCPHNEKPESFKETGAPELPICSLRSVIPPLANTYNSKQLKFEMLPSPNMLQCNRTTHREFSTHRIEWSWTDAVDPSSKEGQALRAQGRGEATANGEFVRSLKLGDVITVWAKARFPGWTNQLQSLKVEVYWSI